MSELNKKGGVIYHAGGRTEIEPGAMSAELSEALVYGSVNVFKGKELYRVIPWASVLYIYVRGSPRNSVLEDFTEEEEDLRSCLLSDGVHR